MPSGILWFRFLLKITILIYGTAKCVDTPPPPAPRGVYPSYFSSFTTSLATNVFVSHYILEKVVNHRATKLCRM